MEKTILIAGGGTGGHFFPALSFLQTLYEHSINTIYVGTKSGIEYNLQDMIPTQKIFLNTKGFVGKSPVDKLKSIYSILNSSLELNSHIKNHFLGFVFGGYASLPVGILSFLKAKKLFLHEQNSIPSLTNRILSKKASVCFTTFHHSSKFFKNTARVGMPLRKEFLIDFDKNALQIEIGVQSPCILVMGGSQGAKALNDIAIELFKNTNYHGIIISGEKNYQEVYAHLKSLKRVKVYPFSKKIYKLMKVCDIAICRAGAGTIYELSASKLPAIFIPYPYAAYNHQYFNALEIEELGGGILINQSNMNLEKLLEAIEKILQDRESYAKNIHDFCLKDEKGDIILAQDIMLYKLRELL